MWYNNDMVQKRAIAFDIGDKRIGVAVSDPFNEYAMPCETYFRTHNFQADVAVIAKIAQEKGVGVIVCGMPVHADGTASEQTEKTKRFIQALQSMTGLPVVEEDERFTTLQAKETQMMGGVKQGNRKKTVDSIAASYILESYLQRENQKRKKEKIMNNEELLEESEEERIIELVDDEGKPEKFLHIGTMPYKGTTYCFFQKAEPETEEEQDEVVILTLDEENEMLYPLEDEQLLDEVFAEFCNQYEDFEDADEAMQLEQ